MKHGTDIHHVGGLWCGGRAFSRPQCELCENVSMASLSPFYKNSAGAENRNKARNSLMNGGMNECGYFRHKVQTKTGKDRQMCADVPLRNYSLTHPKDVNSEQN